MKKIILLVGLCVFACTSAPGWERDFAENPSAEEDRNRDGAPDGWRASAYDSPAVLKWDKSVAHTGKASLRISDSRHPTGKAWNENTGRWVSASKKEISPGAKYTLSAWVKTRDVNGKASVCIAWWKDGKWHSESYAEGVSGTTDWKQISVTAKAPPQANSAMIYLNLGGSDGTAWFDDIHMTRGESFPGNFRSLDISTACNTGFTDEVAGDGKGGWTDQGKNDIRSLPTGDVNLRGIPFHIINPPENDGRACIVLKGKGRENFPDSAVIPVNRKCDTVYFLHCCAWGRDAEPVGSYEIVYGDGSTRKVPLRRGREIMDWWGCRDSKESAVGWEGSNAESDYIGLSIFPVKNPRPEAAIKEIRFTSLGRAVPILVAVTTADGPAVLTDLPIRYDFTDTSDWYEFTFPLDDTNLDTIDLTGLLDPPAGKHGFLKVRDDGHFYFQDGTRARFFGTNICGSRCFMEREEAEATAARLAKYGVNLLRIHAIDSRWGHLIDYSKGDSRHLDEKALDRLDYFFAQLKKRGIYVYFDMLDYRKFMDGDGVKDASKFEHGWRNSIKGATIFNDRLIELQKEFAEKFFTHYNPYTKLRYVDDPAVAVVEITNENSVFYFSNTKLTLPCYLDELRRRWNEWLLAEYGGRDKLARAWTNAKGESALLPGEDPARSSVILPIRYLYQKPEEAPYVGERSPARVNAMIRFFFDIERRYYGQIREHLRKIGIKVPITGTNQTFCPASNFADACNDFMSRNNYWCHPNVHAKPFFTFRNLSVLKSDIPATPNPMTSIASSSVAGKPMISPEFNFPWPIEFRAECLPLMAAYACLQDWDGLLFFCYSPRRKALEMFGNQSDPVRWGEFPAAALMFHRRDVSVAKNTVYVGYSRRGIFSARPSHGRSRFSPYRYLTYISKVRNCYFEKSYDGGADLVVASGYSPAASYASAKRAVVFALNPWADWAWRDWNRPLCGLLVTPGMSSSVRSEGDIALDFRDFLWRDKGFDIPADTLIEVESLPPDAQPIGKTRDGKRCLGFVTGRYCVVPHASALGAVDAVWNYRLFAEAARKWGLLEYDDFRKLEERYISDTRELCLDAQGGVFTVNTARTKAAVGFLGEAGEIDLDGMSVNCATPFAAVLATSLDGKPLGRSRHVLVTAVARAENTGQAFSKNRTIVPERGREPVLAEPVRCRVTLKMPAAARAFALDETGKRRGTVPVEFKEGSIRLDTTGVRSPWCELVVE